MTTSAQRTADHLPPPGFHRFHPEFDYDFQLNRFYADAAAELPVEELEEVAVGIGDPASWADELLGLSERGLADGRPSVAAFGARAAAFYMDPADPRRRPALRRYVEISRARHGIEDSQRAAVPFGDAALPAYCLDPPDPTGTVVLFGGFDSMIEEFLALAALLRDHGLGVILFDGPGQGTALEEGGPRMTPDWHLPVAAVLDHFEVGEATLFGMSLGGCLAIRAAAREPRVRRVVCDGVMTSLSDCMLRQLSPGLRFLQRATRPLPDALISRSSARLTRSNLIARWGIAQAEHVFGARGTAAVMREARRYVTGPLSGQVSQDVLLFAARDDHYVPPRQLTDQLGTLSGARSVTAHVLGATDFAGAHCHVGNLALPIELTLSWLASLDARERSRPTAG